ncbi:glutaredoxin family protein ['Paenibacillus yunnanensis' Narsing Rao et al. 2020]|uniref:glutaredoxin family protein n=1 Tax=Paenibacillus tengchongensis TaxID=2608684 RepID=UPI00124DC543|nr:glutaredoxin family protein [Paenibacillus tengchongensis]
MSQAIVYSTAGCADCNQVKQWLSGQGIAYEVRDIMSSAVYQEEVEKLGFMGIPVTVFGGQAVKGFDLPRLQALFASVVK